ncbi:MAG: hypothetical protein ACYTBS_24880, partial [Planctomycetota bacterium]
MNYEPMSIMQNRHPTNMKQHLNQRNQVSLRPDSRMIICLLAVLALAAQVLYSKTAPAEEGLIASAEPDWPQWRGPRRDGISDEEGLLSSWPKGGPRLLWKIDGLG